MILKTIATNAAMKSTMVQKHGCVIVNKNKIVSRNELMQHMWDCDLFIDDNTLTVNINRLRKKLEYLQ